MPIFVVTLSYKYNPETALIVANHLSSSKKHEESAKYFKRAIKLNPQYEDAWVLLGHELIELRQESEAIKAYRSSLSLNN